MPERAGEVPFGWKLVQHGQGFEMKLNLLNGPTFEYLLAPDGAVTIRLMARGSLGRTGHLEFRSGWPNARSAKATGELELQSNFRRFAAAWMPRFRRNCWLAGCDIEATAHEKIEWMQGFTREELEALNLKFLGKKT